MVSISVLPPSSPSPFSLCNEIGMREEPSINTTSLSSIENAAAISQSAGFLPFFSEKSETKPLISFAVCLIARDTFRLPSSRMNRLISPAIIGTAYVENLVSNFSSYPAIAFKKPIQAS